MKSQVFHTELIGIGEQLKRMEEEFSTRMQQEEKFVSEVTKRSKSRIKLNVGGMLFQTSLTTLTSHPDSMLAALFSGRFPIDVDDEGYFFIDRDGDAFRVILSWLRTQQLEEGLSSALKKRVVAEARYYQLSELENLLMNSQSSLYQYHFMCHCFGGSNHFLESFAKDFKKFSEEGWVLVFIRKVVFKYDKYLFTCMKKDM
jgi:hypothetical protein